MSDEYPVAVIIKRRPNPSFAGMEIVTIKCPLCGKKHEHGFDPEIEGTSESRMSRHRSAHCCDPFAANNSDKVDNGYIIQLPS